VIASAWRCWSIPEIARKPFDSRDVLEQDRRRVALAVDDLGERTHLELPARAADAAQLARGLEALDRLPQVGVRPLMDVPEARLLSNVPRNMSCPVRKFMLVTECCGSRAAGRTGGASCCALSCSIWNSFFASRGSTIHWKAPFGLVGLHGDEIARLQPLVGRGEIGDVELDMGGRRTRAAWSSSR